MFTNKFRGRPWMTSRSKAGRGQWFCDNNKKVLVLKSSAMGGGEGVKNCVTSYMDDPSTLFGFSANFLMSISISSTLIILWECLVVHYLSKANLLYSFNKTYFKILQRDRQHSKTNWHQTYLDNALFAIYLSAPQYIILKKYFVVFVFRNDNCLLSLKYNFSAIHKKHLFHIL